jgi:hypothetical protein
MLTPLQVKSLAEALPHMNSIAVLAVVGCCYGDEKGFADVPQLVQTHCTQLQGLAITCR